MSSPYPTEYFAVSTPIPYVAHIEINRPEKLNAFKAPMWQHLEQIVNSLSHDAEIRAVVISGRGPKAFTAGLDVDAAASSESEIAPRATDIDTARTATRIRRHILEFQNSITAMAKCEKPIITVLHGYSYGLAIDLSSATDIRICAEDTKFCIKEVDIGLAADIGTLSRLPKLGISMSWIKEAALSARPFGATEALRVGYVSEVLPTKDAAVKRALEIAGLIASKSPVAVQGTKAILDYSVDHGIADGLQYTAVWNAAMLQTQDMTKAMRSGLTKRTPTFEKL